MSGRNISATLPRSNFNVQGFRKFVGRAPNHLDIFPHRPVPLTAAQKRNLNNALNNALLANGFKRLTIK